MDYLLKRRIETNRRLDKLRSNLNASQQLIADKACVYVTGSFGRCDASKFSDLDVFIVGHVVTDKKGRKVSALKRLDDIVVKAELIKVTRKLSFPDFDADGQYLSHYSVDDLIKTLGHPKDDVTNTFTARLLLLLESQPLIGSDAYKGIVKQVLTGYWKDFSDNKNSFIPGFITNDILRLWRTLCINYEVKTKNDTPDDKASRKVKNFKLKHSRMLTCYSSILYMLHIYNKKKTVCLDDVLPMVFLTPTARLEWLIAEDISSDAQTNLSALLRQYSWFLEVSNKSSAEMNDFFKSKAASSVKMKQYDFGNTMCKALNSIGNDSLFHRIVIV